MKDALIMFGAVTGVIIGAFFLIILGALFLSFPVMWCWNYIIPSMFGLSVITYWQAFSLYVLAGLLIKGSSSSSSSN